MKRPKEDDYFEFRGKQIIIDYGSAENYIDAQDEYIDYLENKLKNKRELLLAYENYTSEIITSKTNERTAKSLVDGFLANNCG